MTPTSEALITAVGPPDWLTTAFDILATFHGKQVGIVFYGTKFRVKLYRLILHLQAQRQNERKLRALGARVDGTAGGEDVDTGFYDILI